MRIELRPASPAHMGTIATRMRHADRTECGAWGAAPKQALRSAYRASVEAATAFVDGKAEAMMGVVPVSAIEGVGRPWMLATDRAFDCARPMLVLGPAIVERMHERFTRLENLVWAGNDRAIRMLRRWGFEFEPVAERVGELDFVPFWREV